MSHSTTALATAFIRQHGTGPITIDEFDTFIIDNGMAKDPKTDDPKSQKYKGFVNQRAAAKRTLNAAGSALHDEAFMIRVVKSGEEWEVVHFAIGATDNAMDIGKRISDYADNRKAGIAPLRNRVAKLLDADKTNPDLLEALTVLNLVHTESAKMVGRVEAIVEHFDKAVIAAQDYAQKSIGIAEEADKVVLLGNKAS